jgi:RNA-directed DNA polymerase
MKELHNKIKGIRNKNRKHTTREQLVHEINLINSIIRGLIQYYQPATRVNEIFARYAYVIRYATYKALKRFGGEWTPANQVNNLTSVHSLYQSQIPAIRYREMKIGITDLRFATWKKTPLKNPKETPYSTEGRTLYKKRTGKIPLMERADSAMSIHRSKMIMWNKDRGKYNFEYFLNRAYVFNQDKGKCRVCSEYINDWELHIHHRKPKLPLGEVNKVKNLASVHITCHHKIHDGKDYSDNPKKIWTKIKKFREELLTN